MASSEHGQEDKDDVTTEERSRGRNRARLSRKEQKRLKRARKKRNKHEEESPLGALPENDDDDATTRRNDTRRGADDSSSSLHHAAASRNTASSSSSSAAAAAEIATRDVVAEERPPPPKTAGGGSNDDNKGAGFLDNYEPIPLPHPRKARNDGSGEDAKHGAKSLPSGSKWFPSAKVVKTGHTCATAAGPSSERDSAKSTCSLALFYQYTTPEWSKDVVDMLIDYLVEIGEKRRLGGRIRVAREGVNATISSMGPEAVRHLAQDLRRFDPVAFADTDFKYLDDLPVDRHFKELKVLPVKELVFYGFDGGDARLDRGGVHLDAVEYHEKLGMDETVVVDVRNHYEAAIGRFEGQVMRATSPGRVSGENGGGSGGDPDDDTNAPMDRRNVDEKKSSRGTGAEYIDPKMRKSTDFREWLAREDVKKKLAGKQVLMYCTGGVRCERASAYLKNKMGGEVSGVYQLRGGIERYLQAFPDGGYWRGKNFVFDKREAVGADNVVGDGGVVVRKKKDSASIKKGKGAAGSVLPSSVCCCCGSPWDRYVGKKKCYTCGVPVLMCDRCMSQKIDKIPEKQLSVRCPLCVEENITVPAAEVEYTANGVKSCLPSSTSLTAATSGAGGDAPGSKNDKRAAKSVLKWGGGHASKKKQLRRMKRKMCRFGADCVRKDCYFAHPGCDTEQTDQGAPKHTSSH